MPSSVFLFAFSPIQDLMNSSSLKVNMPIAGSETWKIYFPFLLVILNMKEVSKEKFMSMWNKVCK